MELQNQIYVIISVFAGLVLLLLILIVLLSIYVKKSIEKISTKTVNEDISNNDLVVMNKHAVQSRNSESRESLNLAYASEIHTNEDGYNGNFAKARNFDSSETCHAYDNLGYRKDIACANLVPEKRNDMRHHGSKKHSARTIGGQHFSMMFDTDGSNIFHMDRYCEASDDLDSATNSHNVRCADRRKKSSTVVSDMISTNDSRVRGRPISGNNTNGRPNQHHANKNIKHKDVVDTLDERNASCYYYARDTPVANISFYERGISY
ncbi:uncharacterized protein LOC118469038 [Anopheles albimanus]|uniref:uncharacterized protein LOC118469038 n=1 Tax=Anopheles albimanus TaxID=7167 RepID=UPI00163EB657|nr:uncharacterized protein LOC118469038 [Anopheles albimanus]